jgi:hypothetical protein
LIDDLQVAAANGDLMPGDMLPPVRELTKKYHLSAGTVSRELQQLVDAGVLRAVPRVGVFVAGPLASTPDLYLMLTSSTTPSPHIHRIRLGFEERVAQLGAISMTLSIDLTAEPLTSPPLPNLAGVFEVSTAVHGYPGLADSEGVPRVRFYSTAAPDTLGGPRATDTVHLDDVDGGRQAAQHLLRNGHQKIAFLGLHAPSGTSGRYVWSQRRAQGWREVMESSGHSPQGLAFLPKAEPRSYGDDVRVANAAAERLIKRQDITAVVCANDNAAVALLAAHRKAGRPADQWPAVVGYDELPEAGNYVLTSLRMPWESLGQQAANLLWQRHTGRLTGPPQLREVKMLLIPRASSRTAWPKAGTIRQ